MTGRFRHLKRTMSVAILGLSLAGVGWASAPLPGGADIQDLVLTKDWLLTIDGQEIEAAEIYYSDYEVAWLVHGSELGALLISPRGNSVQAVTTKSLPAKATARASLKAGSTLEQVATFTTSQRIMSFELEGKKVELKPAPPLLGRQSFDSLEDRHPQFKEKSVAYSTRAAEKALPLKRAAEDISVRVYFGSWSPICERIVPKIIAVEKEWQSVRFEYYGLPKVIPDDETAREAQITGVPTIVVLRDGEEVDRYTGRQLDDPVEVLERVLSGV